jgi:hypothetical protein
MKTKGGVTYIGISLRDLNNYFKDDAVIHVSKKFMKNYEMIRGEQGEQSVDYPDGLLREAPADIPRIW